MDFSGTINGSDATWLYALNSRHAPSCSQDATISRDPHVTSPTCEAMAMAMDLGYYLDEQKNPQTAAATTVEPDGSTDVIALSEAMDTSSPESSPVNSDTMVFDEEAAAILRGVGLSWNEADNGRGDAAPTVDLVTAPSPSQACSSGIPLAERQTVFPSVAGNGSMTRPPQVWTVELPAMNGAALPGVETVPSLHHGEGPVSASVGGRTEKQQGVGKPRSPKRKASASPDTTGTAFRTGQTVYLKAQSDRPGLPYWYMGRIVDIGMGKRNPLDSNTIAAAPEYRVQYVYQPASTDVNSKRYHKATEWITGDRLIPDEPETRQMVEVDNAQYMAVVQQRGKGKGRG